MQQYGDVKAYRSVQSHRESQPNNHNLKEMIALVHEKQRHYKKALSQIHSSLQQPSNLKYLFNSSNCINVVTPQQKEIIKEEILARGSIPEFQSPNEKDVRKRNLRLKLEMVKKHKSMVKKPMKRINQPNQLKRYQTQPHEQDTQQLKRSILCIPRQLPSIAKNEQPRNKIRISIAQIKRSGKNTQKIERIYYLLKSFNPFFAKIDKTIGVCLLRIGEAYQLRPHNILYEHHATQSHFFIILDGEVKLKGYESMHKLCVAGETLLEQILFLQKFNGALQRAAVANEALILEINMADYDKLLKELYKFGYKHEVQQLISLIRRNFILKNWSRNKFKHIHNG